MSIRLALAISLLLHAAMIAWPGTLPGRRSTRVPPLAPLSAVLLPAKIESEAPPQQPALRLPDDTKSSRLPKAPSAIAERVRPRPGRGDPAPEVPGRTVARLEPLAGEAAEAATRQIARELFYPEEAVRLGLEGEVVVQLFLDESGHVIAARLERSSGHRLLDDAAVRAARTVRSLPASAPREALLPVRFRLR